MTQHFRTIAQSQFQISLIVALILLNFTPNRLFADSPVAQPNILWITSEDNGRFLGCYGDANASTPNLDALASRGVRYTHFYANAPVCAVARSGWITGVPAVTTGTMHMRSRYRQTDSIVPYPVLLRNAGYYATNNSKTDYNTSSFGNEIWDECGNQAHFKNRKTGQPFFAVFNFTISHESQIFPENVRKQVKQKKLPAEARVPADAIQIPPYQISTPELVEDWRRMYDQITQMDGQVGSLLAELTKSGQADNTIIVYCSDHGGITPRSKRYLYDSGTHVPMIVVIPSGLAKIAQQEPDQPNDLQAYPAAGSVSNRLVQFMDLPPTLLSLTGVDVPKYMTGQIFIGEKTQRPPMTVFLFSSRFDESPDMRRGVTDGRWKYIRNFESDLPRFQMLTYPMSQLGHQSFFREFAAGKCNPTQAAFFESQPTEELYDTQTDPHEVNNLAASPDHASQLAKMQSELRQHILAARDTGFIPEPMLAAIDADPQQTIFEFAQSAEKYSLENILHAADLANRRDPTAIDELKTLTTDRNSMVRYWAVLGLRTLGAAGATAQAELEQALQDSEPAVRIVAAEALGNLNQHKRAIDFLLHEAKVATSDATACWALAGLKYLDASTAIDGVKKPDVVHGEYSLRMFEYLKSGGDLHHPARRSE